MILRNTYIKVLLDILEAIPNRPLETLGIDFEKHLSSAFLDKNAFQILKSAFRHFRNNPKHALSEDNISACIKTTKNYWPYEMISNAMTQSVEYVLS